MSKLIGAAAVIVDDQQRVLLVKHSYGKQNWDLPGGKAEIQESAEETAKREVREEVALANIDLLPLYIDVHNDGIHLDTPYKRASDYIVWPLPIYNLRYKGSQNHYMIEIYETCSGEKVVFQANKNGKVSCWKMDDPKVKLSKSTITALNIFKGTKGVQI